MTAPRVGLMAFHESRPIELLYLIRRTTAGETWRVRAIFTMTHGEHERDEFIRTGAELRPIHTQARQAT